MNFTPQEATTSTNPWFNEQPIKALLEIGDSRLKGIPSFWDSYEKLKDNGINEERMSSWSTRNYGAVGTCSIIEIHPDEKADDHDPPHVELASDETDTEKKDKDVMLVPKLSRYEAQETYEKRIAEIFAPVRTAMRTPRVEKKEEIVPVTIPEPRKAIARVRENLRKDGMGRRPMHRFWWGKKE